MNNKLLFTLSSLLLLGVSQAHTSSLPTTVTPHAIYGGVIGQAFPHSDYVEINPLASTIIVSGQAADNADDELFQETIDEAVTVALANVERLLKAAGAGMENIVYMTMAVKKKEDWTASAAAYNKFFDDRGIAHRPARNTVQAVFGAEYRILFTAHAAILRDESPFSSAKE